MDEFTYVILFAWVFGIDPVTALFLYMMGHESGHACAEESALFFEPVQGDGFLMV